MHFARTLAALPNHEVCKQSHHHLGLRRARLEAPELEVGVKGEEPDSCALPARQLVQHIPDGCCNGLHRLGRDGWACDVYDEEVRRRHGGPHLHQVVPRLQPCPRRLGGACHLHDHPGDCCQHCYKDDANTQLRAGW